MLNAVKCAALAVAVTAAPALAQDFVATGDWSAPFPQQGGEAIYHAVCAGCHMPDGQGATSAGAYPALAGNDLLEGPDYPIYMVMHGQRAMPAIGWMLDDQQVADVVNYIRHNLGNDFEGDATAEDVAAAR